MLVSQLRNTELSGTTATGDGFQDAAFPISSGADLHILSKPLPAVLYLGAVCKHGSAASPVRGSLVGSLWGPHQLPECLLVNVTVPQLRE